MSEELPPELAAGLARTRGRRGRFGASLHYVAEIGSTNDGAASLAARGAGEGTTVVAGRQTAGRGRLGRTWHSPPDAGLYFSVVVRTRQAFPLLTLAAGVAVAEGIRAATGLPVDLKWPNDVVVADERAPARRRKVAGVLAEATSDGPTVLYVVLGVGVNVRGSPLPAEVARRATCLEAELGRAVDAGAVLGETLAALETNVDLLAGGGREAILARWRMLAPTSVGSRVTVTTGSGRVSGITDGIDREGALLVRIGGRTERIIAGEVQWD
jgi:BirA family biotin operon repressor/biotin-[acetyl-CoA-carboxylase] ligase